MTNGNTHNVARHERRQAEHETAMDGRTDETREHPRLLACLLIVPSDAEPIVALLEQLAANSQTPINFPSLVGPDFSGAPPMEDRWLEHAEAAKCLGISKSTLYRYACQQKIECRKIAGRLQYRQSALEKLKKDQTRPARVSFRAGGIIPAALRSGK